MQNGWLVFVACVALTLVTCCCLALAAFQFARGDRVDPWVALIGGLAVRELAGVVRWYEHSHMARPADPDALPPPLNDADA